MAGEKQGKSNKRKRLSPETPVVDSSRPSHLPPDSINPFSRSPGQLLQFSIAGLDDIDEDPSLKISDFPHRGLNHGLAGRTVELESEVEQETPHQGSEHKLRSVTLRERQLSVLLQSIHQFLDQGGVSKASRAYGLILQIQPHGKPIDIRHHGLWAIGAEILMRHGEESVSETVRRGADDARGNKPAIPARWGHAANMNKVKAYFETLIQQYPYDYRMPQKISALDFWLAMLSCEIYNAHAEHVISLNRLKGESQDWDEDMDGTVGDDDEMLGSPQERREARLSELKDEVRKKTLVAMRDISSRMDNVAHIQPFPKSHNFFKLRATASLYLADLVVPVAPASELAEQEGQVRRHNEQETARVALEKVLELGGHLDRTAMVFLGVGDEELNSPSEPIFSSLPIRQG